MPEPMPTKARLAGVLEEAGLTNLAHRAAAGEFDDYESEATFPKMLLVRELASAGRKDLVSRAIAGEWDGTGEEADAWYAREGKYLIGDN